MSDVSGLEKPKHTSISDTIKFRMAPKINKLIGIYTSMISSDHHKSRDGYFTVQMSFNGWNDSFNWWVEHNGYINEFGEEAHSAEDAFVRLERNLIRIIKETIEHYRNVLKAPDEYDVYYPKNMEELIERFEEICAT